MTQNEIYFSGSKCTQLLSTLYLLPLRVNIQECNKNIHWKKIIHRLKISIHI